MLKSNLTISSSISYMNDVKLQLLEYEIAKFVKQIKTDYDVYLSLIDINWVDAPVFDSEFQTYPVLGEFDDDEPFEGLVDFGYTRDNF